MVVTEAGGCAAQIPCAQQPLLKIVDQDGNLITNIGNAAFPWTVVASLSSSSNPNASLILETEATVSNGYATFTQLGVSQLATFSLSFKFKTPEGIDESKFDPKEQETAAITATLPVLSCKQYGSEITVASNTGFDMTVTIVDQISKVQIADLAAAVGSVSIIYVAAFFYYESYIGLLVK